MSIQLPILETSESKRKKVEKVYLEYQPQLKMYQVRNCAKGPKSITNDINTIGRYQN